MRFAIATSNEHTTWPALRALWEAADAVDLWESAWTGDHFLPFLGDPAGPCFEGWVLLTALAQHTRRLRIGVLVSGMPHRHPAVLAKMAATLDVVTDGRLALGLGATWNHAECGAFGLPLGSTRERMDRFDEGVEVVDRLLTAPTTTFSGRYYRLTDARCEPKPVQRPRPPFTIGGPGERRTAAAVARWGDHWDLGFTPPAAVPGKLAALAGHCAALGRDPAEVTVSAVVRTAGSDGRRDLAAVADDVRAYEDAGCRLALIEALADDPAGARAEIERLTAACEPLASAMLGPQGRST
jgi:F420-dependent oxidoreductase-like protein